MSYQLELRHLRYFLAVAEELHFRKAADKLFISQPGLSRQIKQMEQDLGIVLFERDNRNVTLTKAGEYLQKEISINLKVLDTVLKNAKRIHKGIDGNLNFGYVGSAMQNIIPELLVKIRSKYPNIHFNLKEMDNQKQLDNLHTQEIDIGFVRLERVPNELKIQPILEDTFSLVLPKNHKLNSNNFKDLSQLKDEPFIMFDPSYSPNYHQKIMQIFDYYGFTPIISHRTVHASSIYKLVEHNFGISIVPTSLQLGNTLNAKFIELKSIPQRTILSAVWSKNNRNPILEKIIEFLVD
ncbi:LysR family transcriptional regulator [Lutibacter citreus]|uniref:LysR family transcriptional regulator n=1 Tax=Lutibacter citreus TaxID=2138210 RepID=UPI000DBE434A|nr:LysR family transcriptional regulator [Lutibacter citreus]